VPITARLRADLMSSTASNSHQRRKVERWQQIVAEMFRNTVAGEIIPTIIGTVRSRRVRVSSSQKKPVAVVAEIE